MRIVAPQLGLDPKSTLGGEIHDVEVLNRLAKNGHQIFVLLPKQRKYLNHPNLNVTYAPIRRIFPPYIFNIFVFFYLFKLYRKIKFDLIRVHNPYFVGPAALLFRLWHQEVKVVAMYHHLENSFIQSLVDRLIANKFDAIVVPSQFTKSALIEKYQLLPTKINVFYSGLDDTLHPENKSTLLLKRLNPEGKKILLFFSSLLPRKNPGFMLDVLANISDPQVLLVMAGSGPLRFWLKMQAHRLGINDRIRWIGHIKKDERCKIFNLADVFLFPSKLEGFGMSPAESLLCGKVPIVSSLASMPEVVRNKMDGLVLPLDKKIWADAIVNLLHNANERQRMGERGRQRMLAGFTWDKTAKNNEELYWRLINQR